MVSGSGGGEVKCPTSGNSNSSNSTGSSNGVVLNVMGSSSNEGSVLVCEGGILGPMEPPRRRAYTAITVPRPPRIRRQRSASPPRHACTATTITTPRGGEEEFPLPRVSSLFAGVVVGSPLGSGPLNGSSIPLMGLPPTSLSGSGTSPPLSSLPPPPLPPASSSSSSSCLGSSPPTPQHSTSPLDYFSPIRRPRLPSASEAPTVAPIPENLPLPDTPPRHLPHSPSFVSTNVSFAVYIINTIHVYHLLFMPCTITFYYIFILRIFFRN